MPEWLKGADCKSAGFTYVGSNPTRPIVKFLLCFCKFNLEILISNDAFKRKKRNISKR